MKIAHVCPYDIDRPGGVQRHILDLSISLEALGHEVTVIAPLVAKDAQNSGRRGVRVVHVGVGRPVAVNETVFEISLAIGKEWKKLGDVMRSSAFDVLHLHTPINPFLPVQALLRSEAAKVATFHAVPPETRSGPIQRSLNRLFSGWIAAKTDGIILTSSALENLGVTGTVLPPAMDLRRFLAAAPPIQQYVDGRINILYVGRLEPRKGVMSLVQAYAGLCRRGLPVRLLVAGDGPERSRLGRFVVDNKVPNVTFLGRVDDPTLPRLYATCDVFCAPSLYGEGFGITLAEAMASSKPVVAAANAGYRTVLHGEAARFLTRPGDVVDLEDKLAVLATQPALRESLGAWGGAEAMRYDCETLAPAFVSIYDAAIQTKRNKVHTTPDMRTGDLIDDGAVSL